MKATVGEWSVVVMWKYMKVKFYLLVFELHWKITYDNHGDVLIAACFMLLSQHTCGGTEENYKSRHVWVSYSQDSVEIKEFSVSIQRWIFNSQTLRIFWLLFFFAYQGHVLSKGLIQYLPERKLSLSPLKDTEGTNLQVIMFLNAVCVSIYINK